MRKNKTILIYGEFSGFGKSLAYGFKEEGYNAEVFSPNGDGFKKIESSITLKSKNLIGKVIELLMLVPRLSRNDIIFIMNPSFFSIFKGVGVLPLIYFILKKKKMYLLCCGDDVEYIKSGESGVVKNFMYKDTEYPWANYFSRVRDYVVNYLCARFSTLIIPMMYDYEIAWKASKFSEKVTKVIPLACYFNNDFEIKKTDYNKIQILHGINRPNVKGTEKILNALERIEKDFDNVVIHTPQQLSQREYLELFKNIDIAIDQCKCHGYGMNAIYSMLHGHVVLAPADEKFNQSLNIKNSPIIPISYDENIIYNQLKRTISDMNLDNIKKETYRYAVSLHDPKVIAKEILSLIE